MRILWAAAAIVAQLCAETLTVNALPSGFEDREVLDRSSLGAGIPVDFAWTPTGQLIVVKKEGEIQVYDDPDGDNSYSSKTVALDLSQSSLCVNSERGVEGVEVHPDFENNRYIFLYYTYPKNDNCLEDPFVGPVNRLSRFVLSESNTIDINSETVFFETPPLEYDHHNSGDIAIGKDGYLYVTVGDGGSTFMRVSADPGNMLGSIIRLTLEGDIPPDNPFTFESGESNSARCNATGVPPLGSPPDAKCQEIFAMGLRNPFRFAMDPNTEDDKVRFYVNDVGQGDWEEVSEGGSDFAGAHYGWPMREGPCPNREVENCAEWHPYQDPTYFYLHSDEGGACTGGAFVPNGLWPAEYDGTYIYSDYVYGHMYLVKDIGTPACITCNPPESNMDVNVFTDYDRIVTVKFGSYGDTQALYYASANGAINRVTYIGSGNRSPEAVIRAEPTSGPIGVTVQFSGATSEDLDGDGLNFEWDFDGDGVVDNTDADTSFTYNDTGLYIVTLTVDDGNGGKTTTKVEISVGNKPVPVITSPAEGSSFAVGDIITLVGYATDNESEGSLADTSLTWEVRQHHDTHFHPFLDETVGNNIKLEPAPAPEDYEAAGNSYLEIILTATDSDGLSSTVSRVVQPKLVYVDIDTSPSGLDIYLDGSRFTTPGIATTWENHTLIVHAPDQIKDGLAYVWSSWSDEQGQSHDIRIPPASATNSSYFATFTQFKGTFPPTEAPTEPYKCVPGFLGIVAKDGYLSSGDTYINDEYGVYITQQDDGNLVVRRGNPDNPGEVVWEHGETGKSSSSSYFTRMQGNSNLMTVEGTPDDKGDRVWKSDSNGLEGDYFLGIDCNSEVVSIYEGRWNNPGNSVWNSMPTPEPSPIPAASPMSQPTIKPSPIPAASPTRLPIPSPSPTKVAIDDGECRPEVLLVADEYLESNSTKSGSGAYLYQEPNGNLCVRKGTKDAPMALVWQSNISMPLGNYFTRLQRDGNLVTRPGTGGLRSSNAHLWNTGMTGDNNGDYFLGLDCNDDTISVYEGIPENPKGTIWTSPVGFTVPFDARATDFTDFVEMNWNKHNGGDCFAGPVDATKTSDEICNQRGSFCTVGWTEPGEELHYAFNNQVDQDLLVRLRVGSPQKDRKFTAWIEGVKESEHFFYTRPGGSWDTFDDYVYTIKNVPRGQHVLKVYFDVGWVNLCSVGVLMK